MTNNKHTNRKRRKAHIRKQISGTADCPRLSVYRSNQHISAQLIDDVAGVTLISANDIAIKKGTKIEKAGEVGKNIATLAKKKKITKIVFDRNGYKFHGRVKALADSAREGGLEF